MGAPFTLDDLHKLSWDWRKSALLIHAHATGVFDQFDDGESSADEIAKKLGADPRATALLLLALSGAGVVIKRGEKYALSETAARHLVSSSTEYRGDLLTLDRRTMGNWMRIPEILVTGKPIPKPEETDEARKAWQGVYSRAMAALSSRKTGQVVDALPITDGQSLLDIASGPAAYLIELARRHPGFTGYAFDKPETEPVVRDAAAEAGVGDRIKFIAGDMTTAPFEGEYDGVFISQALHIYGYDQAADIVRRASQTLKPGGFLAIQEMTVGPDDDPGEAAIFAVQMMLGTVAGMVYTVAELEAMLLAAGLVPERVITLSERDDIIIGRKGS